jgi:uncharacterized damage-inducible protein DinB
MTQVTGLAVEQHLERLASVRELLLGVYAEMSPARFRRVRALPSYDVTPGWVLYHLVQHEAEHRGQIKRILRAAPGT